MTKRDKQIKENEQGYQECKRLFNLVYQEKIRGVLIDVFELGIHLGHDKNKSCSHDNYEKYLDLYSKKIIKAINL